MPWSRTDTATACSSVGHAMTTMGRPSPCSIALTSRLRRIRSTRRLSTSAIAGPPGVLDDDLAAAARGQRSPSTRPPGRTVARMSVGSTSSTAAPASNRLISSRSVSSASNRSSSSCSSSADRATAGSKSERESWMRSPAIRIVVSGVRSSCETSETNRCCTRERSSSWADLPLQARRHLVERRRQPWRGRPRPWPSSARSSAPAANRCGDVGGAPHRGRRPAG